MFQLVVHLSCEKEDRAEKGLDVIGYCPQPALPSPSNLAELEEHAHHTTTSHSSTCSSTFDRFPFPAMTSTSQTFGPLVARDTAFDTNVQGHRSFRYLNPLHVSDVTPKTCWDALCGAMSFKTEGLEDDIDVTTSSAHPKATKQLLTSVKPYILTQEDKERVANYPARWKPSENHSNELPSLFEGKIVSMLPVEIFHTGETRRGHDFTVWPKESPLEAASAQSGSDIAEQLADMWVYNHTGDGDLHTREWRCPVYLKQRTLEETSAHSTQKQIFTSMSLPESHDPFFEGVTTRDTEISAIRIQDPEDDEPPVSDGIPYRVYIPDSAEENKLEEWDFQCRRFKKDVWLVSYYRKESPSQKQPFGPGISSIFG